MLICSSTCDVEPSGGFSDLSCLRSGADHNIAEIPGRGQGPRPGSCNPTLNIQRRKLFFINLGFGSGGLWGIEGLRKGKED